MNPEKRPLISICIPAYRRPDKHRRLLQSISIQKFRDFELIITDDSGDDSVMSVIAEFPDLPVTYYANPVALGTPANWNFGISKAKGEWIKIMHDDDWFTDENSLGRFAEKTAQKGKFIISRYSNVYDTGRVKMPAFPTAWQRRIIHSPLTLMARNVIGPPSVTLIHSSIREEYDERMKWRVDMDYYIRLLRELESFQLINQPLINVGISESQVTNSCINMPEVELPEGLIMLEKYGTIPLNNILVYDAWWRIIRNVGVRSGSDLSFHTPGSEWPQVIKTIVKHESVLNKNLLHLGIISKLTMFFSYLLNRKK